MPNAAHNASRTPSLPLFYKFPVVLRFGEHRTLGLATHSDYAFTAHAIAVPAGVGEFMSLVRHYPIVFTNTPAPMPIAVLGTQNRNLMLDEDGRSWSQGAYIPAYVRRYPFIIVDTDVPDEHLLAIDVEAPHCVDTSKGAGIRLFDGSGGPSDTARKAMGLCRAYHDDHQRTREFMAALQAAGVLVPRQVDFTLEAGERQRLDGFLTVDRAALDALPETTLAHWREMRWFDAVTLHLASQQNWQLLAERASAPRTPARSAAMSV